MLTVIIKDNNELSVVKYTYQILYKEIKNIKDAQLVISENWIEYLRKVTTPYVCFVEADCLVNSGYFTSQLGLFEKNSQFRKLAMLSSGTGVKFWHNKIYGYYVNDFDELEPIKSPKSKSPYPVQVGYVPGSLIKTSMLKKLDLDIQGIEEDLVYLSSAVSLGFWRQGDGNRTHINPNTTYVTTEDYVNDISKIEVGAKDLKKLFKKESI